MSILVLFISRNTCLKSGPVVLGQHYGRAHSGSAVADDNLFFSTLPNDDSLLFISIFILFFLFLFFGGGFGAPLHSQQGSMLFLPTRQTGKRGNIEMVFLMIFTLVLRVSHKTHSVAASWKMTQILAPNTSFTNASRDWTHNKVSGSQPFCFEAAILSEVSDLRFGKPLQRNLHQMAQRL